MTDPKTQVGPTKGEAEAPKPAPADPKALDTAAKSGGAKDEGGRSPTDVVKDLAEQRTPLISSTASGLAAQGSPAGTETAKTTPANEGIQADAIKEGQAPVGQQAEAAFFTKTGSIPAGTIPSPSGPVPASTIHDEATRNAAVEVAREGAKTVHLNSKNSRFRITEHALHQMGPAQVRAVAHDRGYAGVEGGRAGVIRKFLDAQEKDESLQDPPEGHHLAAQPVPQSPAIVPAAAPTGNPLVTPGVPTPLGTLRNADGSTPPVDTVPEAKK